MTSKLGKGGGSAQGVMSVFLEKIGLSYREISSQRDKTEKPAAENWDGRKENGNGGREDKSS